MSKIYKPKNEKKHNKSVEEVGDKLNYSELLSNVSLNKDKASFAKVFGYFAPRVKSYMVKLGCAEEMAEELAQQTLLQVWRKAQLYDPKKAAASTWIFRIARNMRIDMLRKQKHLVNICQSLINYTVCLIREDIDTLF